MNKTPKTSIDVAFKRADTKDYFEFVKQYLIEDGVSQNDACALLERLYWVVFADVTTPYGRKVL